MKPFYRWLWLVFISALLVACTTVRPATATQTAKVSYKKSAVNSGAYFQNDGPALQTPVNLDLIPDAIPQDEPLIASANKPYSALGMSFRPDASEKPYRQTGKASWYGKQFHGRKTSSGERYDMFAMTAAHPTLPIPSYARVTNLKNGESVIVRINDRGPFHKNRLMDLSYSAAYKLGIVKSGFGNVVVERVFPVDGSDRIATRPPAQQKAAPGESYYLQLASFSRLAAAEAELKALLANPANAHDEKLGIVNQDGLYRVRMGPFSDDHEALLVANALNVAPVITR
ncbi:septal ring lytic transglycosylase RlpA family protein [Vogesella oryzae]|uniref:septal ring lytic transglycosylase RlpA family protein n=1 Tax=Vogesella oryzae TaxID=1735285 RepID=UPI001581C441|nr:septal ring lytic transglycosylase RlpA family protein [Vogesella oryzae]